MFLSVETYTVLMELVFDNFQKVWSGLRHFLNAPPPLSCVTWCSVSHVSFFSQLTGVWQAMVSNAENLLSSPDQPVSPPVSPV
jgi:hypothetical protein